MTGSNDDKARQQAAEAERIKRLIATIEGNVARLKVEAQQGDGDRIANDTKRVVELMSDPHVPLEFRRRASEMLRIIQREAYEKNVDILLDVAIAQARIGDIAREKEMLRKGRDAFMAAVRLGSGEDFKRMVRLKMDIILTTSGQGRSERAKRDVEQPANAHEPTEQEKMRRFIRFREPVLLATIDGRNYETLDWSLGGLRIGDYPHAIETGAPLHLVMRLEDDEKIHIPLEAQAVRYNPAGGKLAVKFTSPTSALLPLMKRLHELQIQTIPA